MKNPQGLEYVNFHGLIAAPAYSLPDGSRRPASALAAAHLGDTASGTQRLSRKSLVPFNLTPLPWRTSVTLEIAITGVEGRS